EAGGGRIVAALDALLDAERKMTANFVVELARVGTHGLLLARRRGVHDSSDGVYELRPLVPFTRQLRLPGCGQPVVLRALVGFARRPGSFQPATFLEAVQRRVERSGFDLQEI